MFKSLFTDISGQMVLQLIMLLVVPFYLEFIPTSQYGYWLTITSLMAWLALTDLGIGMALTRTMLILFSKKEKPEKINKLINTSFLTFSLAGLFFFIFGISLLDIITEWLEIEQSEIKTFRGTYSLAVFIGAISLPLSTFNAILEACNRLTENRLLEIISTIIGLFIGCFLIYGFEVGVIGIAYGLLARTILKGLISVIFAKRCINFNINFSSFSKGYLKELFSFGGYFQLARIANSVSTSTDNIIIAAILGASFVVPYNMTMKLSLIFGLVISSKIPIALFPHLTTLIAENEIKKLKVSVHSLLRVLVRLAVLVAANFYYINEHFVTIWVGSSNYGGDYLNLVFTYWILFETIIRGSSMIIYSYGDMKKMAYFSISEAVFNLALSFVLGYQLGLVGIALATAISRTFTIGIYLPRFLWSKNLIHSSSLKTFGFDLIRPLPSVCITGLVYYYSNQYSISVITSIVGIVLFSIIVNVISFEFKYLYRFLVGSIKLKDLPKQIISGYAA